MSRKYLLNGDGADARTLINAAKALDDEFASECILTTSRAASILREYGHTVEEVPDGSDEG